MWPNHNIGVVMNPERIPEVEIGAEFQHARVRVRTTQRGQKRGFVHDRSRVPVATRLHHDREDTVVARQLNGNNESHNDRNAMKQKAISINEALLHQK